LVLGGVGLAGLETVDSTAPAIAAPLRSNAPEPSLDASGKAPLRALPVWNVAAATSTHPAAGGDGPDQGRVPGQVLPMPKGPPERSDRTPEHSGKANARSSSVPRVGTQHPAAREIFGER